MYEKLITEKLLSRGLDSSLTGFKYLVSSISKVLSDGAYLDHATALLYAEVAEEHSKTRENVQVSMKRSLLLAGIPMRCKSFISNVAEELRCEI